MSNQYQWASPDAIQAARGVDLYGYLLSKFPNNIRQEGDILHAGRLNSQDDLIVTKGRPGYRDTNTGETGDPIECLVRYFNCDVTKAVVSLCEFSGIDPTASALREEPAGRPGIVLPARAPEPQARLYDYMTRQVRIPSWLVQKLAEWGQLYQEGGSGQGRIVFVNPEQTLAEIYDPDGPSRQILSAGPGAFWWFKPNGPSSDATAAYICETPIDAMSLYLFHLGRQMGEFPGYPPNMNGLYCAIGSTDDCLAIERIWKGMANARRMASLALNHNDAADRCISQYRNMVCESPVGMSWSEDWIKDTQENEKREQWAAEARAELQAGRQPGNSGLPPLEG